MTAFFERHFEAIDRLVVGILALSFFGYSHYRHHDTTMLDAFNGNRMTIYATITRLFATIFGFGLTATSIVLAFTKSPRLDILRHSRQWDRMWRIFTRGLGTFIIVTFSGFAAMLIDRERAPQLIVAYAMTLLLLLGVVRLYRVLWAFKNLMLIMTRPDQQEEQKAPTMEQLRGRVPALKT